MRMHWLYIIIFLIFVQLHQTINGKLIHENPKKSLQSFKNKNESLAKLFQSIANEYLKNCTLGIIYDLNYEQNYPIDFHLYFANTFLPLTQETIDFSAGERPTRERYSDKCTNYVIFLHNIFAIKYIMPPNIKSKIVIVSAETLWEIKDFLKSHIARMYKHLLIITHSVSNKHGAGSYLLYTHKLYADGSGSSQPLFLASWINNSITVENINLFPEKLNNGFMGHRLLVSTIENPPFTIRRSLIGSAESDWDGIEIRLLKLSAAYLNFTVEFTEPRSAGPSSIDSIKFDVLTGTASAATGGIYQTEELIKSFDIIAPYTEDCAAFISLASTAIPKYRAILGPFQYSVWMLLCAAYFFLIISLTFNSNFTILSLLKHPSKINTMFWFVFSTYTNSFVIKSPFLNDGIARNSITILLAIYWVFTIIITACYTGSIIAFITLSVYPSAVETADELLTYRYRIGTLDHNGWQKWFNVNTTDDQFLIKLFRKMEYVPSALEGVKNASRAYFWPYAFLGSKTTLDYIVQTDFAPTWATKRSLMHISKECFVRYNVVQLFPVKSLYTKYMNTFVNRAIETGLIEKIISDIEWIIQRIATKTNRQITKRISRKIQVNDRILTVEDTQGMFLILAIGLSLAVFVITIESSINFIKKCGKNDEDKRTDGFLTSINQIDSSTLRKNSSSEIKWRPIRGGSI
ncbi:PREDICTED: glutamate receptor ionotropic, kainate 5 [Ceratosolen solmsi marchali]|uniref:Glutamate receptor ionotropic, kainate 5 n=1 Tax=Ceratosolen solmsi marchali TaxID=326594 RepID=A0AAJ6YP91_9HYME|nr:PREDICTED: glutamate receptor ionotropic, kainate 5 [Ceratosolen solmsi marchali]